MKVLFILALIVVGLLIVRMMLNSQLPDQKKEKEPEKKPKERKRSKRKREKKEAKEWTKPEDVDWKNGDPVPDCPNRKNPHHVCTPYCFFRWGQRSPKIIEQDK